MDVNAHPAKLEVRFREGRMVHDFLFQALHRSLAEQRPGQSPAGRRLIACREPEPQGVECASRRRVNQAPDAVAPANLLADEFTDEELPRLARLAHAAILSYPADDKSLPRSLAAPLGFRLISQAVSRTNRKLRASFIRKRPATRRVSLKNRADQSMPPLGFALAHIHNIYILAETANGVILVDAHAAHERVTYERLKQHYHAAHLVSQPLLLPIKIKVSVAEADTGRTGA